MRILHIVNEGLFGGVLRVALAESHYLNEIGYESFVVHLFKLYIPKDVLQRYRRANLFYLLDNPLPRCLQDYINPVLRELLGRFLSKMKILQKIDYIILHNLNALYLANYIKRVLSAKIVLYVHNPTAPPSLSRLFKAANVESCPERILRDYISCVDTVVTSSFKMKRYIREVFGENAYVVPPGCEPAVSPCKTRMRYVLVSQRLSLGKRIHVVAKILSRCKSKFYAVFAGSSHYTTTKALKLIERSGLKRYKIVVNPDDSTLTWLYSHALCSVSIVREPFGMYIIEAASQGTPVVAPRDAGASELFIHGVHGFFFEHENEVPEYVDLLVMDSELVQRMGFEAWKICQDRYTWHHHVIKLVDILKKI